MIKQCVKKPFTVLVAVIICLTLAAVSLTKMGTDLLPEMNMPYMVVITTYPGASPEKVEANLTEPLESALGTVSNVENVASSSAENYAMVMLEFSDDTDMDSALVKVQSAIDSVNLPDECGDPNIMEISMDMMPTTDMAISYDDMDIYELSDFVDEELAPYYERQEGVASVTKMGLVEETVEVRLNQDKIDEINAKLLGEVSGKLDDAKKEITDAQSELDDASSELNAAEKKLKGQEKDTAEQLGEATKGLNTALATQAAYQAALVSQQANQTALNIEKEQYQNAYDQMNAIFKSMTGDDAYQKLYQQILVQMVSGYAGAFGIDTKVTEDNVEAVLKQIAAIDSDTAESIKSTASSTAKAQISGLPTSVEDAIQNPDKLAALQALLGDDASNLTMENLQTVYDGVTVRIPQIEIELANLNTEIAAAQAALDAVTESVSEALDQYTTVEAGKILAAAGFGSASAQIAAGKSAIESGQEQLDSALESYEDARESALKSANIDALLDLNTLSSIIYAQNFAMPAGYIDDADDNQWMLKIGDAYETLDDLKTMVLTNIDGVGDITLEDVADVTIIDNAGESYTRVNGQDAVVLMVYKNSTSSTSEVSKICDQTKAELEEEHEGLHISTLMDQGDYIQIFINNIVESMALGAVLAVFILAIFLKDFLPTLVVAFSIPFSVLVAVLIMYFSGITLNMMSLSGLALGIGMLVDNSIVVLENILRLRNRGLGAARAAVQGAKQVQGAIIASTLTTVCVFLPMIFTSGLTRQLMLPFALTIAFSLLASLAVSLSVVPTVSSVLLKRNRPKKHPWFDRVLDVYGKILDFCLRVKVVPLLLAVALLVFSVFGISRMGVVLIPDMASDNLSVTVTCDDEDISKEDGYALANQVMESILEVDHVEMAGGIGNASALISSMSSDDYSTYSFYVVPDETVTKEQQIYDMVDEIQAKVDDIEGAQVNVSASAMGSMSTMMGEGLQIDIYGDDLETLNDISKDMEELIGQVEGFEEISNGQEDADQNLHLVIDKNAAMGYGLTVAQIFAQISGDLTTEATAATVTLEDKDMDIVIVNENGLPLKDTLLDEEFEVTVTNDDGEQETETHKLGEFATLETADGYMAISRQNNVRYISVTASTMEGYNTTQLTNQVKELLKDYEMPQGYSYEISGEYDNVNDMVVQMCEMLALGFLFIYLVMVAQFQSLLSPFIILFTVPLAFTGGFLGLLVGGEQLSLMSLMGFLVLMGTVVNNGIVFVDYTNQLRLGGMKKRDALIATGKTRMRPILMTAMTTILSMSAMIFDSSTSAGMSRGMAIVVAGGLAYATLMTLFIIPVMYDILFRKQPREVDVGSDDLDDVPDDAAEFIAEMGVERESTEEKPPKRRFLRRKKKEPVYNPQK